MSLVPDVAVTPSTITPSAAKAIAIQQRASKAGGTRPSKGLPQAASKQSMMSDEESLASEGLPDKRKQVRLRKLPIATKLSAWPTSCERHSDNSLDARLVDAGVHMELAQMFASERVGDGNCRILAKHVKRVGLVVLSWFGLIWFFNHAAVP